MVENQIIIFVSYSSGRGDEEDDEYGDDDDDRPEIDINPGENAHSEFKLVDQLDITNSFKPCDNIL